MITHAKLVKRVKDASNPHLRLLRVKRFFAELFTAKQYGMPNMDSCPHRTSSPLLERIGEDSGQSVVRSFIDRVPRKADEGEISIYATADGAKRESEVACGADGIVRLNGENYAGLIQIDALTAAINNLIAELQAHTHGGATPSQTFTLFDKTLYENTTVLHGNGEGI